MPYTPTIWKDGDLITAASMNKIERGIASAQTDGSGGVTIEQVNAAIQSAILDSWEGSY